MLLKSLKVKDTDKLESRVEGVHPQPSRSRDPRRASSGATRRSPTGASSRGTSMPTARRPWRTWTRPSRPVCEDPRAYWARHQVLQLSGRPASAAMADLAKAIELDPLKASYRFTMGELMSRGEGVEKAPDAGPYLGLAVALAPDNENYRRRYEEFLSRIGPARGATTPLDRRARAARAHASPLLGAGPSSPPAAIGTRHPQPIRRVVVSSPSGTELGVSTDYGIWSSSAAPAARGRSRSRPGSGTAPTSSRPWSSPSGAACTRPRPRSSCPKRTAHLPDAPAARPDA